MTSIGRLTRNALVRKKKYETETEQVPDMQTTLYDWIHKEDLLPLSQGDV